MNEREVSVTFYVNNLVSLSIQVLEDFFLNNWKINFTFEDDKGNICLAYPDEDGNRYVDIASNIIPDENGEKTSTGELVVFRENVAVPEYEYVKDIKFFDEYVMSDDFITKNAALSEYIKTLNEEETNILYDYYLNMSIEHYPDLKNKE